MTVKKLIRTNSLNKFVLFILSLLISSESISLSQNADKFAFNNYIEIIDYGKNQLWSKIGTASYYGKKFHMRRTANGEKYNMHENTAAHLKLPFGTILQVTNQSNNKSTLVKINDRGPYIKSRQIDLSYDAAKEINGLGLPKVEMLGYVRGEIEIDDESNYSLVYSLFDEPSILSTDLFKILESSSDFQDIYDNYHTMIESNPTFENNLYILVKLDEYNNKKSKEVTYQIAHFKKFQPKVIPFSVAEKEKR